MTAREPLIRDVTDTAMWVAAYRADESARPDAIFHDPYADRLAGERGHEIARLAKPAAVRHGVVLRTAMLDRLVTAAADEGFDTVLNLAAGLDTRPYRLELPSTLRWVEVDLPRIMEYKQPLLAEETPRCALERVAIDLADEPARLELLARVGRESSRVLVVSEGLLTYLEPEAVARLAVDLRAQPSLGVWLTDISSGTSTRRARNGGQELKAAGRATVHFAPDESSAFFRPYGWVETEYHSLFMESASLGRDFAISRAIRGVARVMPASVRESLSRSFGVARLEASDAVT